MTRATIYFWWHEKHALLPKYGRMIPLLLRFIDGMFGIVPIGDSQKWSEFETDLSNFGVLKFGIGRTLLMPGFFDVTLTLKDGKISSKTYQKPTSLYQSICQSSAHLPWAIKGIIFRKLKRY